MSVNVFAYGTLMFPEVAGRVANIQSWGEPVSLLGFSRYKVIKPERDRGLYPAIIEDDGGIVHGLLFRNITAEQLTLLDEFEEVADGSYERRTVEVHSDSGSCQAEIYVACPRLRQLLNGTIWSPLAFREQELDWYIKNIVDGFARYVRRKLGDGGVADTTE